MCPRRAVPNRGNSLNLLAATRCLPILAAELVLDHFGAVDPLLDVVALHQDSQGVPLAGRPGDVTRRGVQIVVGAAVWAGFRSVRALSIT